MDFGTIMPNVYGSYTSAQTDTELVAALSGYRIGVAAVYVMSAVAGEVIFESGGSTEVFSVLPGDSGGVQAVAPPGQFLFTTASGESLTVTSDIAGEHRVNILYRPLV